MPATPQTFDLRPEHLAGPGVPEATPIYEANGVRVYTMDDLQHMPRPQWLIKDMVEELGLTVFFGPDKVGKTIMLTSFLWAWAAGEPNWFNPHFTMVDPADGDRSVLYILLEGQGAFYSRYNAWCRQNGLENGLPNFHVVSQGVSIFERGMKVDDITTWTQSAQGIWSYLTEYKPKIMVIDTFSRATPGMDENSSEVANFVAWLDHARDTFGTSMVVVHHSPLSEESRPRGHSSLKGAASTYVRISGDPEKRYAKMIVGPHRNLEGTNPHHGGTDYGWYFVKEAVYDSVIVRPTGPEVKKAAPSPDGTLLERTWRFLDEEGGKTFGEVASSMGRKAADLLSKNPDWFTQTGRIYEAVPQPEAASLEQL